MKTFLWFLLLTFWGGQASAQTTYTRLERQLFKLQREWLDAYQKRDIESLKALEAPDFIAIDGDGNIFTRDKDLDRVKSPERSEVDSLDVLESRIRVFGNGAVITGRLWIKYRGQPNSPVQQFAYTNTFIKQRGHWQVVGSQLTRIPERQKLYAPRRGGSKTITKKRGQA